ncbi:hypothetical protein QF004_001185 [Chryseobacterium sp. MDT2-18]|uniref:Uncharacterized protein n=1 Tax=Chryseobacterium salivictor TaxID=2547600 RepID=A0A4P6ZDI3_9FLAO|nr:hypothetical protein [Chryseobacterium sp. MDT2-18]QBO57578.1 hypothetical protein NBC122_00743 [Chryseobacterium salivictor]
MVFYFLKSAVSVILNFIEFLKNINDSFHGFLSNGQENHCG